MDLSWADEAIETLQRGAYTRIQAHGQSMTGKVNDGDMVTLERCDPRKLVIGDIVLVKVKGSVSLNLIKAINKDRFQIGNNIGGVKGWVSADAIYGKATRVKAPPIPQPPGKPKP
ncbi:MAG: hypothetical protein ABI835_10510 [Chloroflexota bacterium]